MDSPSPGSYTPLPEEDPGVSAVGVAEGDTLLGQPPKVPVFLTAGDKWRLMKPMIFKYMLPLCKYSFHVWNDKDLIIPHSLGIHCKLILMLWNLVVLTVTCSLNIQSIR